MSFPAGTSFSGVPCLPYEVTDARVAQVTRLREINSQAMVNNPIRRTRIKVGAPANDGVAMRKVNGHDGEFVYSDMGFTRWRNTCAVRRDVGDG